MKQFEYTIKDELGIHARPAGQLAKLAKELQSTIKISKDGKEVQADRLMLVMGLGVKQGNTITVIAEGANEEQDLEQVKKFFEENL